MKQIKLPQLSSEQTEYLLPFDSILTGYTGSIVHNTHIPPENETGIDDKDIMSVFVSPLESYIGLNALGKRDRGTIQRTYNEWDSVAYDIRKYVYLCLKGNPNVNSLLWLRPVHYIHIHPLGQELIDNRLIFASKQAYHAFCGYAYGQFKRMEHFKREGYQGEKRRRLIEKFGYDTKNAGHLIRLMRMCIEFLNEGELHVFRDDSEMLKDIKQGKWSLDKIKTEAERLFKRAENVYDRSKLPSHPDAEKAEALTMKIISMWHKLKETK